MFFEGSEKKFELSVVAGSPSLRAIPRNIYDECVEKSEAKILSVVSSDLCDAYLLSESSLFIWDDRITMITCGNTRLCHAALFIIDYLGEQNVESFFYERKNEYFPRKQSSDFFDDVKCLNKKIPGSAYRLGVPNQHHLYLFHGDKKYEPPKSDRTIELLMYGLSGAAYDVFSKENNSSKNIKEFLGLDKVFPDFKYDDFVFSPVGYSCNAVKGSDYYTIHVTPQEEGPYVSFETNMKGVSAQLVVESVTNIFKPSCFDVIQFDSSGLEDIQFDGPRKLNSVEDKIGGYNVLFKSYYNHEDKCKKADKLKI